MTHHYILPVLGLLAAAMPAAAAPRACTQADVADLPVAHSYLLVKAPDGKPPEGLEEDSDIGRLVGLFDVPKISYPFGSLKRYGISVNVVVGVDGRVRCASLSPGRDGAEPEMNAERKAFLDSVSGWRFLPFRQDGEAMPIAGNLIVLEEEMPARHVDMPVGDPAQMTVAYDVHGGMYGPSYHVELHGDGTAVYMSADRSDALGPQVYQVDAKVVQALLGEARKVDFWSRRDLYREPPDMFPANFSRVSITVGGVTKSVTGYEANDAGEPLEVEGLDQKIEVAADVKVWQQPTLATIDRLKAGGFDFTSQRGGALLAAWADIDGVKDEVPLALMQLGAPLRVRSPDPDDDTDLLETALAAGRVEMARQLIAKGLLLDDDGKVDPAKVNRDFLAAIDSGEVGAVDLIAPYHPDMTYADRAGSAKRQSVLFKLERPTRWYSRSWVPMARRLLELGADVNARDAHGATLLQVAYEPDLIAFLLDHGADVNATAADGWTPLGSAIREDVALLLLAHGADPRLGTTPPALRLAMKHYRWRKVEAWLRAHGYADVLVPQPGDDVAGLDDVWR